MRHRNKVPITLDQAWEKFLDSCEGLVERHHKEMEELGIDVTQFSTDISALRKMYLIEQTARLRG